MQHSINHSLTTDSTTHLGDTFNQEFGFADPNEKMVGVRTSTDYHPQIAPYYDYGLSVGTGVSSSKVYRAAKDDLLTY